LLKWWKGQDLNLCTRKRPDLQSGAINHSATLPFKNLVDIEARTEEKRKVNPSQVQMRKQSKNSGQGGRPPFASPHKTQRESDKNRDMKGRNRGEKRESSPRQPGKRRDFGDQGSAKIRPTLFGIHAVREAILNPERKISAIYGTEMMENEVLRFVEEAAARGIARPDPLLVEKEDLDRALPKGTVHQGISCEADPLSEVFLPDILNKYVPGKKMLLVLLDQVTDPHNMGAVMRSACAFGADGIVVQSRHAPELTGIVAKTASGAVEHIPVIYETNLARAIDSLKEAGFFAIALDERGEKTLAEAPSFEKTLLVLGAEGPGLRPLVRDKCDVLLRLPTPGPLSSLNVSNAAAVALYAVTNQR
jgi:23S rRNA (guanosine2251-2'-O)-methyltransferase